MLREPADVVRARAERLAGLVGGEVEETSARVGGGALPLAELPSYACAVEEELAGPLRAGEPPVVAVVRDGRCLLDCRTLSDAEVEEAAAAGARGAAHGRHRRPHRPREDVARPRAHRQGHRSPARGAAARHLDRARATRRSSCRTVGGCRSSTCPATSASSARWSRARPGIDLFLLVIDAGEGARPQTREHLAILRLLGITEGVVAVTKADAVDGETLELALAEAEELVPGVEALPVSAKTGAGLDELRARARPGRGPGRAGAGVRRRRGSTSTASSRCAGSAPSRPGRSGPAPSARATLSGSSRRVSTSACAASRCTTVPWSAPRRVSALRWRCTGVERAATPPRRRARRAGRLPGELPARRRAGGARAAVPARVQAPPRHRGDGRARRPGGNGYAQLRLSRADARDPRRPGRAASGHDGRRRTRARPGAAAAAAIRLGSGCWTAATRRRSRERLFASRSRASSLRPGACSRLASSTRAWRRWSGRRLVLPAGVARRAAAASRGRGSRSAARSRRARPGHPGRGAAAARAVGGARCCRCSGSSAAARSVYLPGPGDGARRARRRPRRRWRRPCGRLGSTPVARRGPSSRATSSTRAASCGVGDGLAIGGRRTSGRGASSSRSASARARSRWRASAICSGPRGVRRQLLLERFDADGLTRRVGDARVLRRRAT